MNLLLHILRICSFRKFGEDSGRTEMIHFIAYLMF